METYLTVTQKIAGSIPVYSARNFIMGIWSNGYDIALSMRRWGFDSPYTRTIIC